MVDDNGKLVGLITIKDIEKIKKYPNACKDDLGRLRVGAAVGVEEDALQRIESLMEASVDVVVVDTAHGHSEMVIESISHTRKTFPELEIIAGNVATAAATKALIDAGVDGVKVGVGPGSICTTRLWRESVFRR